MDEEEKEYYRELKIKSDTKKADNEKASINILKQRNIPYKILSKGTRHYRVANMIDFWPSTGVFINMKTSERGRGVFNLIKELKK